MNDWIYSIEPNRTGEENMARDEAMAKLTAGDGITRIRFYSWSPWTLSLGFNQSEDRIVQDRLHSRGYGIVRRPTGGRAVFHAEEITYGISMQGDGSGIHETYARISHALIRGIEHLGGTQLAFARHQPDFREHYRSVDSEGCFSASALNEVMWNGRKVVGSAQRRYETALLQHGSILIGDAHLEIVDFLEIPEDSRDQMRRRLADRTATIGEITGRSQLEMDEMSEAFASGFNEVFGHSLRRVDPESLTAPASVAR